METNRAGMQGSPALRLQGWTENRVSRIAVLAVTLAAIAAAANVEASYVNTTAGGPLRPGVYGRIEVARTAPPPPVIYQQPVTVSQPVSSVALKPVYLYVPPGQARKWPKHCDKYQACALPVYFVRMDNSPSKLGNWKAR